VNYLVMDPGLIQVFLARWFSWHDSNRKSNK